MWNPFKRISKEKVEKEIEELHYLLEHCEATTKCVKRRLADLEKKIGIKKEGNNK